MNANDAITAIRKNYPPETDSVLREALDTAIEVLSLMEEGDVKCLNNIIHVMQPVTDVLEPLSDAMKCLYRIQRAARILEGIKE